MTFRSHDMKRKDTNVLPCSSMSVLELRQHGFKGLNGFKMARLLVFVLDAALPLSDLVEESASTY